MIDVLVHGLGLGDAALLLNRLVLGSFYVLARFRFFYDPSKRPGERCLCSLRHGSLTRKMSHCGFTRWPLGLAWTAALVEVLAGLALIFGLLSVPAAFGLLVVTLFATKCTAREKVARQNPVDKLDVCASYLWLAEPLYIMMAVVTLLAGPGRWSLDYWITELLTK